jgi:hypothetical protein
MSKVRLGNFESLGCMVNMHLKKKKACKNRLNLYNKISIFTSVEEFVLVINCAMF